MSDHEPTQRGVARIAGRDRYVRIVSTFDAYGVLMVDVEPEDSGPPIEEPIPYLAIRADNRCPEPTMVFDGLGSWAY